VQRKGGEKSGKGREGSGTGEDTKKAASRERRGRRMGRGVGQCRYRRPSEPTRHASTGGGGTVRTLQGSTNALSAAVWADSRVGACIVPR
jgi:hypothetical protein